MDHNVNVNRENAKRLDRCSGLALSLVLTELSSPESTMVQHEYGYDWFLQRESEREGEGFERAELAQFRWQIQAIYI